MLEYLKKFEKIIVMLLAVMMSLVVLLSVIELGWILLNDIITPPVFLLNINELLDIFGLFLLVLIGIELLYTIKAYAMESVIHAEVVLTVAMIAIGRKVYNPGYKRNFRSDIDRYRCCYHSSVCWILLF